MHYIDDVVSTIVWTHPTLAWVGVVASVIMGIAAWWFVGRYQRYIVTEDSHGLGSTDARDFSKTRAAIRASVSLVVLSGILGIADPERKVLVADVQYTGACVGIGVDASFSMLANERYGSKKTRLTRALEEVEKLTESFPSGDRLSLMAFAGTPEIFSPRWTNDRRVFFTQLHHLNESYVSIYGRTGSDIPSAMGKWFVALPEGDSCQVFLVLFTDGEPEGEESALAQQLVSSLEIFSKLDRRVITFLVAIGDDRESLRIREYDTAGNFSGFAVKEDGSYIFSRPDLTYLSDIAVRFHGKLIYAQHHDENLQYKISSSIAEARKIAAMRTKAVYQSIAPWCAAAFLIALSLLLCALARI